MMLSRPLSLPPPTACFESISDGELAVLDSMVGTRDPDTVREALKKLIRSEWSAAVHRTALLALAASVDDLRLRALHALWIRDSEIAGEVAFDRLPQLIDSPDECVDEPVLLGAMLAGVHFGEDTIVGLVPSSSGVLGWWQARRPRKLRALAAAGMELVTRRSLDVTTPAARRRAVEVDGRWRIRRQSSTPPPPSSGIERLLDV